MKPPPITDPDIERHVETLLRQLHPHIALGIVMRWVYGVPPKRKPPSLLGKKPEKHL